VWLRDFLPKEVKNIRTIAYGYDTNLREANWKDTIYEMAKSMLDSLFVIRVLVCFYLLTNESLLSWILV
jgi:hypothetical protein